MTEFSGFRRAEEFPLRLQPDFASSSTPSTSPHLPHIQDVVPPDVAASM
jgi:hypothetical protein